MTRRRSPIVCHRGQGMVEFALTLPLALLIVLGIVEVGYALLDQQVVARLTREGSNLISRGTSLQDAVMAIGSMSSRPVDFDNGSTVIFSVIKRGGTTGTTNFDQLVLYQRHTYGTLSAQSRLTTAGGGSFGGAPDYIAANSDNDASLRVTNVPSNLVTVRGGMIYVTEIYTRHNLITPFDRFGATVPNVLYSIAYF